MPLRSYHFDIGNSNSGPLGFCARVTAHSKAEALKLLQDKLEHTLEIHPCQKLCGPNGSEIEYMNVYLNPDAITVDDCRSWDSVESRQ